MNAKYPEFKKPREYKPGDEVQVKDVEGNLHPGTIAEILPSGRYRVKSGKHSVAVTKDEIFPVAGDPEAPSNPAPLSSESSVAGDIKTTFAELGSATREAGENRNRELVEKNGYVGFRKDEAAKAFREQHPEWNEEQVEGEYRFSPPKPVSLPPGEAKSEPAISTDADGVTWHQWPDGTIQGIPPGRDAAKPHVEESTKDSSGQSATSKSLDAVQTGLDAVGVADPTPITDGINAVTSLIRAGVEPDRAGEHLKNAAISAVSMIPYVGDTAKAAKYGGKAAKEGKLANAAGDATKATDSVTPVGGVAKDASGLVTPQQSAPSFLGKIKNWWTQFSSRKNQRASAQTNSNATNPGGNGGNGAGNAGAGGGGGGGGNGGAGGGGNGPIGNNPNAPSGGPSNAPVLNLDKLKDQAVEVAGTFGAIAKKAYDFADHIDTVNRQLIEYNRSLSRFNGQLSAAYGKLDSDRILREIKSANTQGESLAGLVAAQSKLEDALQGFKDDWRIVGNDIQQVLTKVATYIIEIIDILSPIEELWPYLRKYLVMIGLLDKKEGKFEGFPQELQEVRKRIADMQKNPRKIN